MIWPMICSNESSLTPLTAAAISRPQWTSGIIHSDCLFGTHTPVSVLSGGFNWNTPVFALLLYFKLPRLTWPPHFGFFARNFVTFWLAQAALVTGGPSPSRFTPYSRPFSALFVFLRSPWYNRLDWLGVKKKEVPLSLLAATLIYSFKKLWPHNTVKFLVLFVCLILYCSDVCVQWKSE